MLRRRRTRSRRTSCRRATSSAPCSRTPPASVYSTIATLTVTNGTVPPVTNGTAPTVTQNPTSKTVLSGQSATFTAAATGTPAPAMMWQVLPTGSGAVWQNLNVTSPSFTIAPNILQTGYQFRAMFTNSNGIVYSTPATLIVDTAPVVRAGVPVRRSPPAAQ